MVTQIQRISKNVEPQKSTSLSIAKIISSRYPSLIFMIAVFIVIISSTRFSLIDDAYISFRYAYQFAQHGALVFNLGENVEGITNLLWTILLAIIHRIFNFPIEDIALFSSLLFIFLSCVRLWQLGPKLGATYFVGTIASILLLSSPEFIISTTNGLEAALFSFLLIEIVYQYSSGHLFRTFLLSGLLFMTRPEGLFFGIVIVGLTFLRFRSFKKIIPGIIILGGFVIAVTCYRYITYGLLVPNSVIDKSFPLNRLPDLFPSIIRYAIGFVKTNPLFIILAIASFLSLAFVQSRNRMSIDILLLSLITILFSFIVMARNGGDWMANHRLLAQYSILYVVLLIILVGNKQLSILFAIAFIILPFLQITNCFINFQVDFVPNYQQTPGLYSDVSNRLAPVINDTDTVSAEAIGYISYKLINHTIIDPLGLTNTYIAKNGDPRIPYGKSDFQYLVGTLKPSVMVWHYPGHLRGVNPESLLTYESYCQGTCVNWEGSLVMIRKDRVADIAPAFSDWKKIDINSDWKR